MYYIHTSASTILSKCMQILYLCRKFKKSIVSSIIIFRKHFKNTIIDTYIGKNIFCRIRIQAMTMMVMEKRKKKLVVVVKILLQVKEKILLVLLKRKNLPCLKPRQIRPPKKYVFYWDWIEPYNFFSTELALPSWKCSIKAPVKCKTEVHFKA